MKRYDEADDANLEVHASANKDGLSLKARGAGLFVLLAIDLIGLAVVGFELTQKGADMKGLTVALFQVYVAYELIASIDAISGVRRVSRQ